MVWGSGMDGVKPLSSRRRFGEGGDSELGKQPLSTMVPSLRVDEHAPFSHELSLSLFHRSSLRRLRQRRFVDR